MRLYSPRPSETARVEAEVPDFGQEFVGKSFAIIDHGGLHWGEGESFATALRDRLLYHGVADVEMVGWDNFSILAPPSYFDEIAARVAGAVTGLGQ